MLQNHMPSSKIRTRCRYRLFMEHSFVSGRLVYSVYAGGLSFY